MKKFWVAMVAFALLALLAWQTLSDERVRLVTLVILGALAFRTWVHARHAGQPDSEGAGAKEDRGPM